MSLAGNAVRSVLHPVQFANHIGDRVWHEAAKRVLGGTPTDEEIYGGRFTDAELLAAQAYREHHQARP